MTLSSTSMAAYHSIDTTELEKKVLDVIEAAGAEGCISDQVQACYPDLSYSSVTARFKALEEKGEIFRAGDTRPGLSGRAQKVMRLKKYEATTPIVKRSAKKPSSKRNPFLAGMMFAAKVVLKEADLPSAKRALKQELEKVAGR